MKQYLDLLQKVYFEGIKTPTRQGGHTYAVFGEKLDIDLSEGFPLLTVKDTNFDTIKKELAGFLKGAQSLDDFYGIKIWDKDVARWAEERGVVNVGYMGRIYGAQWRDWDYQIDQLSNVVSNIMHNPFDRRHIVTAWNPSELELMCLPPCHLFYQFQVTPQGKLNCTFYMRSVDTFLGLPFDIASYALLTHIVANETNYKPGKLVCMLADTHIYEEHIPAVQKIMIRKPKELPILMLDANAGIDSFEPDMAQIVGYEPHEAVKAQLIA